VRVEVRLTAERLAVALDTISATTTPAGAKPLAGGSNCTDCSDWFPAFSARFSSYKYPEGFKPIGITKYDGKQAPQQWLRCYSTAIEVAGGSNITKVIYFPMALDPVLLTWLESLGSNSIDSWE
jgi:hypothetical protein